MKNVIVIGGGITGLTAALTLAKMGLKVTVLEARARLGGRIFTSFSHDNATPIELGASYWEGINSNPFYQQYFSAENKNSQKAHAIRLDETKSAFIPQDREPELDNILKYYHLAQKKLVDAEKRGVGKTFAHYIQDIDLSDLSEAEQYWTKRFLENSLQHHCTPLSEGGFPSFVRSEIPDLEAWNDKDADFCFVQNGYHKVIQQISAECEQAGVKIRLNAAVNTMTDLETEGVELKIGQELISADKVISTIPIGVLKKKAAQLFTTPLSKEKLQAFSCIGVHDATRVILEFPGEPFWDNWDGPYLYLDSKQSPTLLEFRNAYPLCKKAILLTGKYSDIARKLYTAFPLNKELAEKELVAIILQDLKKAFPHKNIPLPIKTIVYCWTHDPFAEGAYPYRTIKITEAVQCALEKKEGNIYFAGADFSRFGFSVHHGYSNGQKVARELLADLN